MAYVTQGTVQVTIDTTPTPAQYTVQITRTSDYTVAHKSTKYTAFVGYNNKPPLPAQPQAILFAESHLFDISPGLERALETAAFQRIKLEITINNAYKISRITFPATP